MKPQRPRRLIGDVAELLDATVASVNSAMQRARRALEERLPDQSQQRVLRRLGDERVRDVVTRFADAFERGDVDVIVDMLVDQRCRLVARPCRSLRH